MDDLRRTPLTTEEDETNEEHLVVSHEHEQEKVLLNIRRDGQQSNERLRSDLRTFLVLSAIVQIASFSSPSFFIDGKPIYGAQVFTLLNIRTHSAIAFLLFPALQGEVRQNIPEFASILLELDSSWIFWLNVLSAVSPIISVLSGRSWLQTAWWSMTFLLIMIVRLVTGWIRETEANVREAEVRYERGVNALTSY